MFTKKSGRFILFTALLITLAFIMVQRARAELAAERAWREIQQTGWLGFGIDPGNKTFSFYDDSGWNGLDADVAKALCRELMMNCASAPVGYDAMYDALLTHRVEAGISAWTPDDSKRAEFAFSEPYFVNGLGLLQNTNDAQPQAAQMQTWLKGKRIAVPFGGNGDAYLRRMQRNHIDVLARQTASVEKALWLLDVGEVDGALIEAQDAPIGQPFALLEPEPYVIVTRASDARLLAEINRALLHLKQSGELTEITRRWLARRWRS